MSVGVEATAVAVRWLAPHLPAGVLIANMATELATASVVSLLPGCRVIEEVTASAAAT